MHTPSTPSPRSVDTVSVRAKRHRTQDFGDFIWELDDSLSQGNCSLKNALKRMLRFIGDENFVLDDGYVYEFENMAARLMEKLMNERVNSPTENKTPDLKELAKGVIPVDRLPVWAREDGYGKSYEEWDSALDLFNTLQACLVPGSVPSNNFWKRAIEHLFMPFGCCDCEYDWSISVRNVSKHVLDKHKVAWMDLVRSTLEEDMISFLQKQLVQVFDAFEKNNYPNWKAAKRSVEENSNIYDNEELREASFDDGL